MAVFRSSPATFDVTEIPAYTPCGSGEHTYAWIEKRGLTTEDAVRRLARELRVRERDCGYAGRKDRHATARQWVSLPGCTPEAALAVSAPDLTVLQASRHGNKLRIGHLKANRFEVVITELGPGESEDIARGLAELGRTGLTNFYGEQRFGADADNVRVALAVIRGERREPNARRRRFLFSALQSAVFNRSLTLRAAEGGLLRVYPGDVLKKTLTGGLFVSEDIGRDQARVLAGEVVPTGPMPGGREIAPPAGSEADALEKRALADLGVSLDDFAGVGRDLPGARRPVLAPVTLDDPAAVTTDSSMHLRFTLPTGSYATVLLVALGIRVGQPDDLC